MAGRLHLAVLVNEELQLKKLVRRFVKNGLKDNRLNVLIVSKDEEPKYMGFLKDIRMKSEDIEILLHEELYSDTRIGSSFKPILKRLISVKELVRKRRKSGLQIIGTIVGNLYQQKKYSDCFKIEKHWQELIPRFDMPIVALCPYKSVLPPELRMPLMECHDGIINLQHNGDKEKSTFEFLSGNWAGKSLNLKF
jgi:hypothetical protein